MPQTRVQSVAIVEPEVDMAKAKRARRTSFRTMESDSEAMSVLDKLEELEAQEKATQPSQDEPPAPDVEDDAG
jgi:hypothetical protein